MKNKLSLPASLTSMVVPLQTRNYRLLFGGQLVSTMGDAFYEIALPWFMLSSGRGAQALGFVLTAYGIPRVAGILLGGPLSDKLGQRSIMLLADCVRTLLVGVLALLVFMGHPDLWTLYTVVAIQGLFGGLFTPAAWSITPAILADADLQVGNALQTVSTFVARFVGAALAGVVVARFQPGVAFVVDALSFVVSALTLAYMRFGQKAATTEQRIANSHLSEEEAGTERQLTFWQFLLSSRYLQILLIMVIFMNLGSGATFEVALPSFVHDVLRAGAVSYGSISAGFAVGAFVGACLSSGLGKLRHRGVISLAFFVVQALALAWVPFLGGVEIIVFVMVVAGVMNSLGNVSSVTVMQQALPRYLLGRIMAALAFCNFGFYPLSVAIAGLLIARVGPIPIFLLTSALIALPALFGLLQRTFWELP